MNCMSRKGTRSLMGLLAFGAIGLLLVSGIPPSVVHATIDTCSGGSACSIWWDYSLWNGRYVGNTLEFDLNLYNTAASTPTDTVASVQLVTPWGTYSDNTLPQTLCYGCDYYWYTDFTIPTTASPDNYTITLSFTGTYSDGTAFCASENNVCSDTVTVDVKANPDTQAAQIASLQSTIASLNQNVTSLKSQISTFQSEAATIQAQLTTAKGNITSLKTSLAATNSQLTVTQRYLASNETALASAKSSLAATQSSFSTATNLYLPVGVAVPSIVAILLAILYLRKRPNTTPS